jgi:hypothetical protein
VRAALGYPRQMIRALALLTALLVGSFGVASAARAQGRISIEELTIDGDPPPEAYRAMLVEGIRPSVERIRDAYGQRLAERPTLGGDYRLRMWISNHEVIRITPESSIGDETMERLTREAIYAFRLPDAAPTGGAWVRFVVRFTPPPPGSVPPAPAGGAPSASTPSTGAATTGEAAAPAAGSDTSAGMAAPRRTRTPTVRIDRISGALAESAIASVIPVPALASCIATPRTGTLRMTVAIDRRGRITATPGTGTFRHRASITCMERAIESLSPGAEAGPTRIRLTLTIPAEE